MNRKPMDDPEATVERLRDALQEAFILVRDFYCSQPHVAADLEAALKRWQGVLRATEAQPAATGEPMIVSGKATQDRVERLRQAEAFLIRERSSSEITIREVSRLADLLLQTYADGLEAAAKAVPTTWLDPLLTGTPFGAEVEPLLRSIKARIEALIPREEAPRD